MISVTSLAKIYGTRRAVDNQSFAIEPGRASGFVGPNCSGKSMTIRMMVVASPAPTTVTSVTTEALTDRWPGRSPPSAPPSMYRLALVAAPTIISAPSPGQRRQCPA